MAKQEPHTFCPGSQAEWRTWLEENHTKEQAVWLIYYKKSTGIPSLEWSDAVDEAICFGWIDSTRKSLDKERFMQYFSRRKPNSTWSKINKDKVEKLLSEGKMTPAGMKSIEVAKENGSWNILDSVEAMIVPEDLERALAANKGARAFYDSLKKGIQKGMLYWLVSAKRPETRAKRIKEIAEQAAQGQVPKPFRIKPSF